MASKRARPTKGTKPSAKPKRVKTGRGTAATRSAKSGARKTASAKPAKVSRGRSTSTKIGRGSRASASNTSATKAGAKSKGVTGKAVAKNGRSAKPSSAEKPSVKLDQPTKLVPEAQAILDRAVDALHDREFAEAATLFLAAHQLDPSDWRVANEAGICLYQVGRYREALPCYDLALGLAPDEVQILANKGLALALLNRDGEAEATFMAALRVDGTYPPAFLELGKLLQKQGKHQDAIEYFTTALAHETMRGMFDVSGRSQISSHLIALAILNKARILLGPLDRESEGLAQVRALWDSVKDDRRMLLVAREVAAVNTVRALRIVTVLLDVVPNHPEALELRAELAG